MKRVWQIFKQHPVAFIVYLPYAFLFFGVLSIELRIKNGEDNLAVFEGIMSGLILISAYAVIYALIVFIYALCEKESRFYWWLLLGIIIPFTIVTVLGNFDNITLIRQILAES